MRNFSLGTACATAALMALSPSAAWAQTNTDTTMAADPAMNATDPAMNATDPAMAAPDPAMTSPDPAMNTMPPAVDPYANDLGTTTAPLEEEDDNDFPWGLLGLLGLAGLLGRKRRDDDHVRVDRTDTTGNRM